MIEQSIVYPEVWYVKLNGTTITIDEETLRGLLISGLQTEVGGDIIKNYVR